MSSFEIEEPKIEIHRTAEFRTSIRKESIQISKHCGWIWIEYEDGRDWLKQPVTRRWTLTSGDAEKLIEGIQRIMENV